MAYETPTYYGFKVNNNLSDVINKAAVLKNLTLNIGDLNIIRGAASIDGAIREDLVAISNLTVPLYKTLDRYIGDSNEYRTILNTSAGVDSSLRGNLTVNGPIGGSAIRYKFLDYTMKITGTAGLGFVVNEKVTNANSSAIVKEVGTDYIIIKNINGDFTGTSMSGSFSGAYASNNTTTVTKEIKYADISTSRVSAWSTATSVPSDADPIFYGGQLKVANGGTINVNTLTWGQAAKPRLKKLDGVTPITGEIPTHTFTTTINGVATKIYAMKSIPLKVTGFFKRFDGTVNFSSAISGSRVSWRIINTSDSTDIQFYPEQGTTSSSYLPYRAINAAERDVEIYYHPDYINSLYLTNMGISYLPSAQLPALTTLDISYNNILNMPDIKTFAPSLQSLSMNANNLYLSSDTTLRKFGKEVAAKLPSTLTSLGMMGTFYGSIRQTDSSGNLITFPLGHSNAYSVIEKACPNLTTFNVSRGTGAYFGPDDYDVNAYLPSMPSSLVSYNAAGNDFRTVPERGVKDLTNLKTLDISANVSLKDYSTFSIASNVIEYVDISSTSLPIPDLSNKPNLNTFYGHYLATSSTLFTNNAVDTSYKFTGCSQLKTLFLYYSNTAGFIPKFAGNTNLSFVHMYGAWNITGGRPDNGAHGYADGTTYALYKDTFADAKNIGLFLVLSGNLLVGKGIEADTFKNLPSLYYLLWYSYGRTGYGVDSMPIPDMTSCPNMQYMIFPYNNFTGPIPGMETNPNIYYIDVGLNRLTGPVPTFTNRLNLRYLFASDNQLSSFPGFKNTTNLVYAYLHNNQIAGAIPMLGGAANAPNLVYLLLFNNRMTSYTVGSFAGLTRIINLDVSSNLLYAYDLNNIIDDLVINYKNAPRSGVTVNLYGQGNAVGYSPSTSSLDKREKEVANNIDFLRNNGWTITVG